jgi:Spy/CpxP family protein refolding chaperone
MKNWMALVTMFGLLASLTTSQAQQADPDRLDELDARIEQTRQRLNLTDEQSVQIDPILESNFHASMLVLESHGIDLSVPREQRARPNFREMRAIGKELQAVREETAEEMAEILTEEQMEEYRKIQVERRAEMREQIGARR